MPQYAHITLVYCTAFLWWKLNWDKVRKGSYLFLIVTVRYSYNIIGVIGLRVTLESGPYLCWCRMPDVRHDAGPWCCAAWCASWCRAVMLRYVMCVMMQGRDAALRDVRHDVPHDAGPWCCVAGCASWCMAVMLRCVMCVMMQAAMLRFVMCVMMLCRDAALRDVCHDTGPWCCVAVCAWCRAVMQGRDAGPWCSLPLSYLLFSFGVQCVA